MQFLCQLLAISAVGFTSALSKGKYKFKPEDIITRDVAIIGGGSSGTYAAVRLGDYKKTVVVIEQKEKLGGHTETYTDPATGIPNNFGVIVYHNLDFVKNYFARFNLPVVVTGEIAPNPLPQKYVDFDTGKEFVGFSKPDPSAAVAQYYGHLLKYPYLSNGFDVPYPVPEDLLLPWVKFIKKHNLEGIVHLIYQFAQGLGDIYSLPTIYVMKNFGLDLLNLINGAGFVTSAQGSNELLYIAAKAHLRENVLLSSTVIDVDRSNKKLVELVVKTPKGLKLVRAKKILFTAPPKPNNFKGWDLTVNENSLFAKFKNKAYYTAVLQNIDWPADFGELINVDPKTQFNTSSLPGLYTLDRRFPGQVNAYYCSDIERPEATVKAHILQQVKRVLPGSTPKFGIFKSHAPFELHVSAPDIRSGFYKKLYALQGQKNTWYAGAAFHTHDSSLLWRFIDGLLPRLVESVA